MANENNIEKRKVVFLGVVTIVLVFMIGLTFGGFLSKAKGNVNLND